VRKDLAVANQTGPTGKCDREQAQSLTSSSRAPAWIRQAISPLITAVLLAVILVTIPRLPLGNDDDSSWSAVLDYAHQNGLQVGADLVFSYGPLGFLITPYWSPAAPWLRIGVDIALAFSVTAGLCLAAWRTGILWRCMVLVTFTLLAANADPRSELLVFTGLLSWSVLCLVCSSSARTVASVAFLCLAVFASLAKMTLLFPAIISLVALIGLFLLQGQARLARGLLLGFSVLFLGAWVLLGQRLANLGSFLMHGFVMSAGYDQTMWAEPFPAMLLPGILLVLLTVAIVVVRTWTAVASKEKRAIGQRILLAGWFVSVLFIVWKHGFVRADRDHLVVFLTLAPSMGLILEFLPCERKTVRLYTRGLGIPFAVIALLAFNWLFGAKPKSFLGRPLLLAVTHTRSLLAPAAYGRTMRELQEAERQANQLPKLRAKAGTGSVDVFGCNQAYAIFNAMNYRPRPVFQSYAAYSGSLMNLNEQFYFSQHSPDSVLFRLTPIDERFPTMEDAFLFRDLLINYRPLDLEGPFLFLKPKQQLTAPALTLSKEGQVHPGEMISLREYGNANIWLEITSTPTVLGEGLTLHYHPS